MSEQANEIDVNGASDADLSVLMRGEAPTAPITQTEEVVDKTVETEKQSDAVPATEVKPVDATPVQPVTAPKVEEEHQSGIVKDLAAQRERRRIAEAEAAELRMKITAMENAMNAERAKSEKVAPVQSPDELDDDNLVDGRTFKAKESALRKEIEDIKKWREQQEKSEAQRTAEREMENIKLSEQKAREKYAKGKVMADGLEYDAVVAKHIASVMKDDTLRGIIQSSKDPAETAYKICAMAEFDTAKTVPVAKAVEGTRRPAPMTLGQVSAGLGGDTKPTSYDIDKMSDEDLDKLKRG